MRKTIFCVLFAFLIMWTGKIVIADILYLEWPCATALYALGVWAGFQVWDRYPGKKE